MPVRRPRKCANPWPWDRKLPSIKMALCHKSHKSDHEIRIPLTETVGTLREHIKRSYGVTGRMILKNARSLKLDSVKMDTPLRELGITSHSRIEVHCIRNRPETYAIPLMLTGLGDHGFSNKTIFLQVSSSDTIVELKSKIQNEIGMPIREQDIHREDRDFSSSARVLPLANSRKYPLKLRWLEPERDGPIHVPSSPKVKVRHDQARYYEAKVSKIPERLPNQLGLMKVSKHILSWRTTGVYFGLTQAELSAIAERYHTDGAEEQRFQMLYKWSGNGGDFATWRALASAFESAGDYKIIDAVARLAREEQYCETPSPKVSPKQMSPEASSDVPRGLESTSAALQPQELTQPVQESGDGNSDALQQTSTSANSSTHSMSALSGAPGVESVGIPVQEENASTAERPSMDDTPTRSRLAGVRSPVSTQSPRIPVTPQPETQSGRFSPLRPLTSADIGFICRLLKDIRIKWWELGQALRVETDDLRGLSDTECLKQVIKRWLATEKDLRELVEVLQNIREEVLAERIKDFCS